MRYDQLGTYSTLARACPAETAGAGPVASLTLTLMNTSIIGSAGGHLST